MGIHIFCYTHGGERTTSHDVVQDAFVYIEKDVKIHFLNE
jgi:hypothetical protein